jgi:hypothetical protein
MQIAENKKGRKVAARRHKTKKEQLLKSCAASVAIKRIPAYETLNLFIAFAKSGSPA